MRGQTAQRGRGAGGAPGPWLWVWAPLSMGRVSEEGGTMETPTETPAPTPGRPCSAWDARSTA